MSQESSLSSMEKNVSIQQTTEVLASPDKKSLPQQALESSTFYKKTLPSSCIAFTSKKGKQFFKQALEEDNMESYFPLSMQFLTQSEPAFCGLGTLAMVLNALEIDPMRKWKGVWRWYDETMLDCCRPLEDIKNKGITLSEFTCLARCNGLHAVSYRADETTKEQFFEDIKRTSKIDNIYLCVSFARKTLDQTGDGHFSPIGGYNESNRMCLVMDVARFKYPAYWVSLELLWESLHPKDESTNKSRGYVILSRGNPKYLKLCLSQLSLNTLSWHRLADILFQELPEELSRLRNKASTSQVIGTIIDLIPDEYSSIVEDRLKLFIHPYQQEVFPGTSETLDENLKLYLKGLDNLLEQISSTALYNLVWNSFGMKKKIQRIDSQTSCGFPPTPSPFVCQSLELSLSRSHSRSQSIDASPNIQSIRKSLQVSSPVNDFSAFLTIFLFALFNLFPEDKLDDRVLNELKVLVDEKNLSDPLLTEVRLIKDQILAFMES